MLKYTGAEDNYIKLKRNQLSDYRKQYLEFLNETGRTRIVANEWIGTNKINKFNKIDNVSDITKNIILDQKDETKVAIKLTIGQVFDYKGNEYIADNKNVKNEFNPSELEFANWLSQRINKTITLNSKINNPGGIKVSDLKIGDEYYDMKIITVGSNQVIYHNVYKKSEQVENFLFEATNSLLSMELLKEQVNNVFSRKDTGYVNKIGIKKEEEFILLENKKRSDDTRR